MSKTASRPQKPAKATTPIQFHNFYLTESDKKQIKKEKFNEERSFQFIRDLCDGDYRVGISYDDHNSCYIVSATGRGEVNPNSGYTTTARHSDVLTAITSLWYQIDVLAGGGQWVMKGNAPSPFDW